MKESSIRFYISLGSLALFVGSIIVYSTMVSPILSEIQQLRGQRAAQIEAYNNYKNTIEETNKAIAKYQSIAEVGNALAEVVPLKEETPSLMNQLYGLARITNILIGSIEVQYMPLEATTKEQVLRPTGTVRVAVKCSGSYGDMKEYLKAIESNARLMDIYSLDISEGAKKGNSQLQYTIIVDAYYQTK